MRVLALGLPRTGTESLKSALQVLGYGPVYHGFDMVLHAPDTRAWSHLSSAKAAGQHLSASDFDVVLGHCDAVTDQPACLFATELLDAYPDAKVILNRRDDVEAWHRSLLNISGIVEDWGRWARALVDAEEFWTMRCIGTGFVRYFRGDYRRYGREVYGEHYRRLEKKLESEGKGYLNWCVQDGWSVVPAKLGSK